MKKAQLVKQIITSLTESLGVLEKAARASHEEATHESSKAESKYDSTSTAELSAAVVRKPANQRDQFRQGLPRSASWLTPIATSITRASSLPSAVGRLGGRSCANLPLKLSNLGPSSRVAGPTSLAGRLAWRQVDGL
jgi:hypothetical protein